MSLLIGFLFIKKGINLLSDYKRIIKVIRKHKESKELEEKDIKELKIFLIKLEEKLIKNNLMKHLELIESSLASSLEKYLKLDNQEFKKENNIKQVIKFIEKIVILTKYKNELLYPVKEKV